MSAFKGTPGPWEARESRGYVMVHGANGAGLFFENVAHPGATEDAHLIAAAPCLLDALQRLNSATRRYMEERPESDAEWASDEPSVLSIVDAAIAKATGGAA